MKKSKDGARSELGEDLSGPSGQENVVKPSAKKTPKEGYLRSDTLDKPKLKKYIKALAREAKLFRNARKE